MPDLLWDDVKTFFAPDLMGYDPKPFIWTATADEIIEKVQRGRATLKAVSQNEAHR